MGNQALPGRAVPAAKTRFKIGKIRRPRHPADGDGIRRGPLNLSLPGRMLSAVGLGNQIIPVITAGDAMKYINGILCADGILLHVIKSGLPLDADIVITQIISLLGLELVIIQS